MSDPTSAFRDLLPGFTSDAARELATTLDAEGDQLKRRARALLAYADALGEPDSTVTAPIPTAGPEIGVSAPMKASRPRTDKKPLIRALLAERHDPGWSPKEIRATLAERRQIPSDFALAAIRVTLSRMVERHDLVRDQGGLYHLAPQTGRLLD